MTNPFFEALANSTDKITSVVDDAWQMDPVTFDVFVTEHLKQPALTDRQYQDIITFLGNDPKNVFPRIMKDRGSPYNLAVWLMGKGSGKGWLGSLIVCYCFYLMLCLKDPQGYFNFPSGEAIDFIIVSYSAEQALKISFDKIKQRFKNWTWLRQNYSVFWDQKYISGKSKPEIHINNDMIRGYNQVRIMSEHSANESFEGYNILLFIMDEASAFQSVTKQRNGLKVYSTLKTSASSRFPGKWKGLIMSFPRSSSDTDFTVGMYEEAVAKGRDEETGTNICVSKGAPWEIKPFTPGAQGKFYCGETFEFADGDKNILIPIEYKEEFETDPEECKGKYLCEPARGGSSIVSEEAITTALHDSSPLLDFDSYVQDNLIRINVHGLELRTRFVDDYVVTVDLGQINCSAALALQHLTSDGVYVLDAMLSWSPDKNAGYQVDLRNIRDTIILMSQHIPRMSCGFDRWQSELMMSDLNKNRIPTFHYSTYVQDYASLRRGMSLGIVKILKYYPLITQLRAIQETYDPAKNITKITMNPKLSKYKDLVDVVVGGFKHLITQKKTGSLPGTFITGNLDKLGGTMIR